MGEIVKTSGEDSYLQQLPVFLWKATPLHVRAVWFPWGRLSIDRGGL